jgi:cytochrome c oxidase cbb3-type subunit 3/ubiquinol-cytochrome c reductase cytochrome c subunit
MLARQGSLMRSILALVSVVVACVASGELECVPQSARAQAERRGAALYGRMCAVCHGARGEGYRADQATALANADFLASASEDYLREAIVNGRAGTTMSAWGMSRGGPLAPDDVNALLAHLRSWSARGKIALDERPLGGDVTRGATIWDRDCTRCHGARGTGGPFVHVGNPELLAKATNGFLRHAIAHGRSGTPMPAFEPALSAVGADDVVKLLRTWQTQAPPTPRPQPARPPPIPLGPVPLNPRGPEPVGFRVAPATTPADVIHGELARGAKMALLDARAPSDYTREHIAGAVSVPFYAPEPYLASLPKDAWLVAYCACPHAESGQLASKLVQSGFTKVTVLDEGLGVWKAKGYGTRVGIDP